MGVKWLVFDVETVVDGQLLCDVKYRGMGLTPAKAISLAQKEAVNAHGSDFLPYSYQQPIALAHMLLNDDFSIVEFRNHTSGLDSRTRDITTSFWAAVAHHRPRFITFNGRSFDLPLMELMAFKYGIAIPHHYNDRYGPRYRFGDCHVDVMEFMNNYGASKLAGGLDLLSRIMGRSGKGEVAGNQISDLYQAGKLTTIDDYCAADVRGTYIAFLRTRVLTGNLTLEQADKLSGVADLQRAS